MEQQFNFERKSVTTKARRLYDDARAVYMFPDQKETSIQSFQALKELMEKENVTLEELDLTQKDIDELEATFADK